MTSGFVVIGAGLAGLTVAEALRADGYGGPITLIGDEPHAPYHRPPLSKAYLVGEAQEAQLVMRASALIAKKNITLKTGAGVMAIDRAAKCVVLADGSLFAYDGLALCTGSRLRSLPLAGATCRGVLGLRTLADSNAISAALDGAQDVVIIGGGFIGLEVAAAASKKGKSVTVLEAADRLMSRVVAPLVSQFFFDLHRAHGVAVVLGATVSEIISKNGCVSAVRTGDGAQLPADVVIVGVGVLPNSEIAQAAGIDCQGGIVVDACSRTSDGLIVAAGDCTVRRMPDGGMRRLESVHNAVEQGKSAAAALLGQERPFVATPWFWSEQYSVMLQMVGLNAGFDDVVTRGDPRDGKFSAFYYRAGRLLAVDSINQAADHLAGRKLLDHGLSPTPQQAADPQYVLTSLLKG